MKFETYYREDIPAREGGTVAGVKIELDGEVLHFSLGKAGRRSYVDPDRLFDPVNALLKNLTGEQQITLFGAYVRADQLHNINVGVQETIAGLIGICDDIFGVLPPKGVEAWGKTSYRGFEVPQTITEERKPGSYPAHSSYDEIEYRALCALSTTFKLLLPVLFRFMEIFGQFYGIAMKEFRLFQLLDEDELSEAEAFVKLLNYTTGVVSDATGTPKVPMGLLTDGVGADVYPSYVLSSKLIRDLALSETDIGDRGDTINNVAAKITRGINTHAEQTSRHFDYAVKPLPKDRPGNEDGNTSIREDQGASEPYSDLYRAGYNIAASDTELYIKLGIEKDIYFVMMDHIDRLKPTINENKLSVAILTVASRFDPEGVALVNRDNFKNLMACSAALLHQYKLHNLAGFMMAKSEPLGDVVSADFLTTLNAKPDPELLAKAKAVYEDAHDGYNYIERWLDEFAKRIAQNGWELCLPDSLHPNYGVGKRYVAGKDFKDEFLTLTVLSDAVQAKAKTNIGVLQKCR